jgi:hypothetical protein
MATTSKNLSQNSEKSILDLATLSKQMNQLTIAITALKDQQSKGLQPSKEEKGTIASLLERFLDKTVMPTIDKYGPKFLTPILDLGLKGLVKAIEWFLK